MKARFGPSFVYRRVCISIGFKKAMWSKIVGFLVRLFDHYRIAPWLKKPCIASHFWPIALKKQGHAKLIFSSE